MKNTDIRKAFRDNKIRNRNVSKKLTRMQKAERQFQQKGYWESDTDGKPIFRNAFGFFTKGYGVVIRHERSPFARD